MSTLSQTDTQGSIKSVPLVDATPNTSSTSNTTTMTTTTMTTMQTQTQSMRDAIKRPHMQIVNDDELGDVRGVGHVASDDRLNVVIDENLQLTNGQPRRRPHTGNNTNASNSAVGYNTNNHSGSTACFLPPPPPLMPSSTTTMPLLRAQSTLVSAADLRALFDDGDGRLNAMVRVCVCVLPLNQPLDLLADRSHLGAAAHRRRTASIVRTTCTPVKHLSLCSLCL